ncbi:MAG: HEAT repeat domain-containing protein [Nitrospirae bacterium]|nr:HEAT repeat domain-containing protein [Nitrospirota bacterium]
MKKFLDFITHQDKNNWREPYKNANELIEKLERKFFFSVINKLLLKRHAEKVLNNFKATPICCNNRPMDIFEKTEWFQSRRVKEIEHSKEPIRPSDQVYLIQEKDLINLLDDRSLTVLVANGGMGKTVASLYLFYETSKNFSYRESESEDTKGFAPIWLLEPIEIPYDITVVSLIAEALIPEEVRGKKERLVKRLLEKGPKLLLIFDALNEKGEYQKILIDAIIKFHRETIGKHKIIITYRKEQWLTGGAAGLPIRKFLSDEYRKYELLPLRLKQVQAYFNTLGMPERFNALGYSQKEMATIPLFMYFSQQLTSNEIKDFGSEAELCEKILHKWIDAMIYAEHGGVRYLMPPNLIKELDDIEKILALKTWIFFILQELAFDNFKKGSANSFSRDTLRDFLYNKVYNNEGLNRESLLRIKWVFDTFDFWTLIKTIERTGLVVLNKSNDKCNLQFVHSSIQEFLAARKLKETWQREERFKSFTGNEWNGVMIMLSGLLVDSGNLVYSILSRNYEGGIKKLLANNRRFARGSGTESKEWLNNLSLSDALLATECAIAASAINDEYLDEILVQALMHVGITSYSGIKYHDYNYVEWYYQDVMPYLIRLGKFRGVEVFERILSDPRTYTLSVQKRQVWYEKYELIAAKVLEKIGDENAIQFFVKLAKGWYTPSNCGARKLAIVVLGWIKNESTLNSLRTLLADNDSEIRAAAIDAIGYIGGDNAEDILIEALEDEDENVRSMAYTGLGKIRSTRSVNYLIRFLEKHNNEHPRVTAHAVEALGKIGDEKAVEILVEIALTNRGLYDGGPWDTENIGYVYLDAGKALGKIKSKTSVNLLLHYLHDRNNEIRSNAARILGYLKSTETLRPLIEALNDSDPKVRWGAAVSLGEIGDNSAVEPLLKLLGKNIFKNEKDKYVRRVATLALGKIKDHRAINRLCELLNDPDSKDPDLAERAAHSLGEIGNDSVVEQLIQALDYNEKVWEHPRSVRGAIITALGKIRSKKAVQPLLNFYMKYKTATVIESLGYIGDEAAMELIAEELCSDSLHIRNSSIKALKNFDPDKVYSTIRKKIQAESEESKKALYFTALSRM